MKAHGGFADGGDGRGDAPQSPCLLSLSVSLSTPRPTPHVAKLNENVTHFSCDFHVTFLDVVIIFNWI